MSHDEPLARINPKWVNPSKKKKNKSINEPLARINPKWVGRQAINIIK